MCYLLFLNKLEIINNKEIKNIYMWGVKLIEFLLRLLQKLPIHKSIDYYVPTEPMIIHDSIIESITYWLQQPTR